MKVTGVFLMVSLSVALPHTFPDIAAIVNGSVALPCNCSGQRVRWTIFHPIENPIAECDHGKCRIQPNFQKRFSVSGNTSTGNFTMSNNSTLYNDIGLYRCTCDGQSVSEGKLKVYDPRIVKAVKGQNITLPCYGDTRRDAKDVQWKKDGMTLLQYPNAVTGKTSGGRFTMSNESFLGGDLSLHISSVELSDAALYLCLIHGESRDGDPRAVLLEVEEHQPECQPENQPTTPPNSNIQLGFGVTLGLVLLFICIIFIVYCVRKSRRSQNATPPNPDPGHPIQEQHPMIPKPSSTQLFQD